MTIVKVRCQNCWQQVLYNYSSFCRIRKKSITVELTKIFETVNFAISNLLQDIENSSLTV